MTRSVKMQWEILGRTEVSDKNAMGLIGVVNSVERSGTGDASVWLPMPSKLRA